MDLGYLKIKIDIKSEHDEYKKKYEFKRKELKREEIKKIFEGFKDFFKADGHFKFKENEHSISAEYKEHAIKLDIDVYANIDSPDFSLTGIIKTYEKDTFEFIAEGICNKELTLPPPDIDGQERMIHDTRHYKDFLNGEIDYTFEYQIKGRDGSYPTMSALMLAL
jgi:hypothetical protein